MKRVFKRWMAMLLAVLMVMGTLPTTAWAARKEDDAVPATPVVDEKDGVVDTLAKSGKDDVTPIDPVDPDPLPGQLSTVTIDTVTTPDGIITLGGKDVIATGEPASGTDTNVEGLFAIAVVPWFNTEKLEPSAGDYVCAWTLDAQNNFNSSFINNNDIAGTTVPGDDKTYIAPSFILKTPEGSGLKGVALLEKIELLADGTVRVNGADYTSVQKAGGALDTETMISWANTNTNTLYVEDETGGWTKEFDPMTEGYLPYKVLIGGTTGYTFADLKIPLARPPLKVEIDTRDAAKSRLFDYTGSNVTTSGVKAADIGEHLFTYVTLTNNTSAAMTVNVTITRGQLENTPTGYGTIVKEPADAPSTDPNLRARLKALGYTGIRETKDTVQVGSGPNTNARRNSTVNDNTVLGNIYGLLPAWNSEATVGANGVMKTTLTSIAIPANESTTICVAGTRDSEFGTMLLSKGFYIGDDKPDDILYSTYRITAEVTSGEHTGKTAADTAGIHWETNPVTRPKVKLIHGTDKTDVIDAEAKENLGTIISEQDSLNQVWTAQKQHTVKSKDTTLTWDRGKQCFMLPGEAADVPIGDRIFVDGVRTDVVTIGGSTDDNDVYIYVSMGKVTVEDDPEGTSEDIVIDDNHIPTLGHYMWDTTADGNWKKVKYSYYPYGATVGVHAQKEGFVRWTGTSYVGNITDGTNVMLEPGNNLPTEAHQSGVPTKVATAQAKVSGDITAVAHYLTPITLVTLFGGNDLGENSAVNPGDRSTEHVFDIQVTTGTGTNMVTAASYTIDNVGNETLTNMTKQEGGGAWEIKGLDANQTYNLTINGWPIGSFQGNKEKEDTGYHFVVELVGVIPRIKGSTSAADTLVLPDDLNPARLLREPVPVSGAAPNDADPITDDTIVLYYPTVSFVNVSGKLNSGSEISKLTYPDDAKSVTNSLVNGSGSWRLNPLTMKFTESGTKPLTATFGATNGPAKVEVKKDDLQYGGLRVYLVSGSTEIKIDETSTNSGIYSKEDVPLGTYTVRVKNGSGTSEKVVDTGVTVNVDGTTPETPAKVQFWTVTAAVDPNNTGHATVKVHDDDIKKIIDGSQTTTTATSDDVIVLDGTKVSWSADDDIDHYVFKAWDSDSNLDKKTETTLQNVEITTGVTRSHTANFELKDYTVTFKPNGGDNLDDPNADKAVSVKAGSSTGAATPTATRTGYKFDKWLDEDGNEFKSSTAVYKDMTVTAQWTVNPYDVIWNANGGRWTSATDTTKTESLSYDSVIEAYQVHGSEPTRTNYKFVGWCSDEDCTTDVTFNATGPKVPVGGVTYYAKWERKTAPVTVKVRLNNNTTPVTDATVKLTGKSDITSSTTGDYKFEGVDFNEGLTAYKVEVTHGTYIGKYEKTDVTVNTDAGVVITVYFHELTVKTTTKNADGNFVGAVAQSDGTISGSSYTDDTTTGTYLEGTVVNIAARIIDPRYNFSGWTASPTPDTTFGDASQTSTTVKVDKQKTVTAGFTKESFNAYLTLTLNGSSVSAFTTDDVTGITVEKASGNKAFTTRTLTAANDYADGKWKALNLPSENTYTWKVTTPSGTFTATTGRGDTDPDEQTIELFSVRVVGGDKGNDNTTAHKPTVAGVERVIMERGSKTLAANPKDGYELTGWVKSDGGTLPTGASISSDNKTVTLDDNDYNGTEELVLKPTYTYKVTVRTVYNGSAQSAKIELKSGTNSIDYGTNVSSKDFTGLTVDTTYDVWVNDYRVGTLTASEADITSGVTVTLRKITAQVDTAAAEGNPKVNSTAGSTGIYVPDGATIPASGDTAVTVKVDNAPKAGYRWLNVGSSETLWTATGSPTITSANAVETTITGTVTDNIVMTAHTKVQHKVDTATKDGGTGSTVQAAVDADSGSTLVSTNKENKGTTGYVDTGSWVKVTAEAVGDYQLKGWTVTNGAVYFTEADAKAGTNAKTATDDIYGDITTESIWVVPTNTTVITAVFEQREYPVEVTVNLDNGEYNDANLKVWLYKSGNKAYELSKKTGTNNVYAGKVYAGNYTVYANGAATGSNPTTTEKPLNVAANTETVTSQTVNYYTIKLIVDPDNHTTTVLNNSGRVDFGTLTGGNHATAPAASATYTAQTIVLAKASTQTINIRTAPLVTDTDHYRYDTWTATKQTADAGAAEIGTFEKDGNGKIYQSGAYTLPTEANLKTYTNIDGANGKVLTLTAKMQRQYKVTLTVPSYLKANSSSVILNGSASGGTGTISTWIDDGATVPIDASTNEGDYSAVVSGSPIPAFNQWVLVSGAGTFTTADATNAAIGTKRDDGFKVNGSDATIRLELWKNPQILGRWLYDLADPSEDQVQNGGSGKVGQLTWVPNNGQEPQTGGLVVTGTSTGLTSYSHTLVKDTDYVELRDDNGVLTGFRLTDRNDTNGYLESLAKGSYKVTATYILGNTDPGSNQYTAQTVDTTFDIGSTIQKLTKVDIQVKDGTQPATPDTAISGSKTASVDVAARNAVRYEDHLAVNVPKDELVYQWYYADSAPAGRPYYASDDDMTATGAKSAQTKAEDYLNGVKSNIKWTLISGATGATLDISDKPEVKGKYVFALVYVGTSIRADGATITNAIPVDFDATVTVNLNGNPVADAKATNYTVYLWSKTGGTFDVATAIPATHDPDVDGTGKYTTKNSALNAETTYNVYVQEVEGNTTKYIMLTGDANEVSFTSPTATANYYTVTMENVVNSATASNGITSDIAVASGSPHEDFTTSGTPSFVAATGNSVKINSGDGVLAGSTVVAKAEKVWPQDYTLTWKSKSTEAGTYATFSGTPQTQSSSDAVSTGRTYTPAQGLGGQLFISGSLSQNPYTITGNVVDVNRQAGLNTTSGSIKSAKLTAGEGENTTTYTGRITNPASGAHNATVSFTVPKAAKDTYTLTAEPTNSSTTMKGYKAPADTTAPTPVNTSVKLGELAAGTTGADLGGRFTIFVEATSLTLNVRDDDDNTTHDHSWTAPSKDTAGNFDPATGRHVEEKRFGNTAMTKKVVITNKGNTGLTVTPTLEKYKTTDGGATWTQDTSWTAPAAVSGTITDALGNDKQATPQAKNITIANWVASKTLAKDESHEFTVTFPPNLENKDDVMYRFVFTSTHEADATNIGPTLWFDVGVVVNPVTVTEVKTTNPGGNPKQFQVLTTTIGEDTTGSTTLYDKLQKPQDANGLTSGKPKADNDLVYEWYIAEWNDTVTYDPVNKRLLKNDSPMTPLTESEGVSPDTLTYDQKPEAEGKTLYLLAKGQLNAQGAATTPDVITTTAPPMQLPYTAKIRIIESGTRNPINGTDESSNYVVYLWNTVRYGTFDPTASDFNTKAIKAKWVAPAAGKEGYFEADGLYAKAPNGDNTAYSYQIWANTVKGDVNDLTHLKDTGKTVSVTSDKTVDVVYYSVTATETTYDNTYVLKGDAFFGDGTTATGGTGDTPKTITADGIDVPTANNWVMAGSEVTVEKDPWTLDYTIAWTGATEQTGSSPTDGSTAKISSIAANATVASKLTLNLYDVDAYVVGMGYVNFIDMVLTDNGNTMTFTTKTEGTKILGIVGTSKSQINASNNVGATFRLPKGNYETKADVEGMTVADLQGYRVPHNDPTLVSGATVTVPVTGKTSFDVVLQGAGQQLTITDNVPTGLNDEYTDGPEAVASDIASITPNNGGVDGTPSAPGNAKQTIRLNYNYGLSKTVIVTASNTSKQDENADEVKLYNVKFTPKAGNSTDIKMITTSPASHDFDTPAVTHTLGEDDTKSLTLEFTGKNVGTYTYEGDFTFTENEDGTGASNTVHYTLEIIVQPLTFTGVEIKDDDGTFAIDYYSVKRKAQGAETEDKSLGSFVPNADNTQADVNTDTAKPTNDLIQSNDYTYQWYATDAGKPKPTVSWAAGVATVTGADAIAGANGPTFDPSSQQGKDIYLVISANYGYGKNAESAVISDKITSTYQGIVYITVNTTPVNGEDEPDPGYTVRFVNGNDSVQGKWKKVSDAKGYAYVGDLDPTKEYTVKVSRFASDTGGADESKLVTLGTVSNADYGVELTNSNVAQANYFDVKPMRFFNEPYKAGTGETFSATNLTNKPTFTLDGNNVDGKPVLSGQSVSATATTAWTQDYDLTWRMATGNGLTLTENEDKADHGNMANISPKIVQDAATAKATGLTGTNAVTITAKTYIGGRLDQNTYTVTGHIVGKEAVKNAILTGGTGNTTYNATWTDAGGDGHYNEGDTATFTVVAGTYTITAYEETGTTIRKVTVDAGTAAGTKRNINTLSDVKTDTRTFTIHLEETEPKLGVKDNKSATALSDVNAETDHAHADNEKEYIFHGIKAPDDNTFVLSLGNPGNVDLVLGQPTVYRLPSTTPSYADMANTLIGVTALTVGTDGALSAGTTTYPVTVTGLGDVKDKDLPIDAGKGGAGDPPAQPGGTVTVSTDAVNSDDAIYVVKFPSTYIEQDGSANGVSQTGPTIYYVLDLTVQPLPIKEVKTQALGTGVLRLDGGKLDSVLVDDDDDSTNLNVGAETATLKSPADISFLWFSAPADVDEDVVQKSFDWNTGKTTIESSRDDVKLGVKTNNGTTYSPDPSEQGLNFYLVAYRTSATSNASGFAVSKALYAQVTIGMETRRTTTDGVIDLAKMKVTGHLDGVTPDPTSNTGTFTVTEAETHIDFTAAMTDDDSNPHDPAKATYYFKEWKVLRQGETAADKTGITVDENDRLAMDYEVSKKATVIGYYDLLPDITKSFGSYNIGTTSPGISDPENTRTIHYEPHDGSGAGNVQIWIESIPNPAGKNLGFATTGETVDLQPRRLDSFNSNFDAKPTNAGAAGDYVLKHETLRDMLIGDGKYRITFFDLGEGVYSTVTAGTDKVTGTVREGGYAGYDQYFEFVVQEGDKNVTARVDRTNYAENENHTVKVENNASPKVSDESTVEKEGVAGPVATYNGDVILTATPAPGYLFTTWKIPDDDDGEPMGSGAFGNSGTDITKQTGAVFTAYSNSTIDAVFRKAAFETAEGHAAIYYGTRKFLANTAEDNDVYKDLAIDLVAADKAENPDIDLEYKWLTGDDLSTYLAKDVANNGAGMTAAAAAALVAKTDVAQYKTGDGAPTGWLEWNATAKQFDVKAAAKGVNVEKETVDGTLRDVTNELVVYVQVTEKKAGQVFVIPFTIDIKTSELKITTENTDKVTQKEDDGEAYKTKYIAAYGTTGTTPDDHKVVTEDGTERIVNGTDIELDKFAFISIDNVNDDLTVPGYDQLIATGTHNAGEDLDGEGNPTSIVTGKGHWEITIPTNGKHNGAGSNLGENANEYTFQFVYTGEEGDEDNYNYTSPTITLKIPVQRPARALLIGDVVENYGDLNKGNRYSEVLEEDEETGLPTAMAYTINTYRQGETITYLDAEPIYKLNFQRIGIVKNITLTLDEVDEEGNPKEIVGFQRPTDAQLAAVATALGEEGTHEKLLTLTLTPVVDVAGQEDWTGEHYIRFKLTGEGELQGDTVTAYYTLSVTVNPRVITKLDVTATDPGSKPTPEKPTVTPTLDGKALEEDGTDVKGVDPIKNTTVTWGPDDGPDGKHTQVEVTVELNPNYIYAKGDDTTDPPTKDITEDTHLTVKEPDGKTHLTPAPEVERTTDRLVTITQLIPYLMHDDEKVGSDPAVTTGPQVIYTTSGPRHVSVSQGATDLGSYTINLGAYGIDVYDVMWTVQENTIAGSVLRDSEGNELTWAEDATEKPIEAPFHLTVGSDNKHTVTLDLSGADTSKSGDYYLTLQAMGKANDDAEEGRSIRSTYIFRLQINSSNPPPMPDPCPCKVFYYVGANGTTSDPTVEDVYESSRPNKVPAVKAVDGYLFRGWSLTNPATLKDGEQPTLVDPKTVQAKGDTMIFYAVIQRAPYHDHYIIGYPNGNFGPGDDINRAAVATIIARAILPDFVEGANYGNPGGYSDVSGHWAESAIAYCSKFGVFEGYDDGTFKPNRSITRQEFALVIARLDGVLAAGEMDFTDIGSAGTWALGGIYTAYVKGWVNGYPDGTFKPLNNITRAEAVKVFNAYLKRGVDADGLRDLHEYVYPDKNTGNDFDQYRTWPDVPANYWAYYDIIEASNDHAYVADMDGTYSVPEKWTECWINDRWGGTAVSADAAMVSAGFQVWLH